MRRLVALIMGALFLPEDDVRVMRVRAQLEQLNPQGEIESLRIVSSDRWAWASGITREGEPYSFDVRGVDGASLALSAAVRAAYLVRETSITPAPTSVQCEPPPRAEGPIASVPVAEAKPA